ncbi:prosaposin-like [Diabrotica undecimpunctata]|uniref:prosaposin-like n=1 Tax=Diabrotica undecimpunctata TaxID=50387 RepID=UPI003B637317
MKTTLVLTLLFCVGLTVFAQRTREPEPDDPEPEFDCDNCILFTTVIKDLVEDGETLDEVERGADRLCGVLPGDLREYCEHNLLPKVDRIYGQLQKHTPQEVCENLDLC